MQQVQNEGLQLHIIDTTSVFTKQINNNCHFDGSTLVYLAGAHILYHNVFQGGKLFHQRISDNQVLALAFHHSSDLTVLLVTKSQHCYAQFYFYGKKTIIVDIQQDLDIFDAIFLEKKRACLLGYDRVKKEAVILIITTHKKIKKVSLPQKCHKLISNQRKVYILAEFGCYQMNIESQMMERKKNYETISLTNIIITQMEADILFDTSGRCNFIEGNKERQTFLLSEHLGKDKAEFQIGIRIGNNFLMAIKGEFVLYHFAIQEDKIQLINKYEFNQKIRGNIVALQSSVDEMNLAIAIQTCYKEQTRIQHFLFNLSALSNEKKFINPFHKLHSGGEAGEVSHLQCIIPSEAYCLIGPHVINYNYVEHIQKKHKYSIHQSPKSVAVHPLGHQLLCIFETAVKFYQKIQMQLLQTWTQSMICSCARYTDNGLLVLSVFEQGTQNIVVYNPNSFKRLRTYNGLYLKHSVSRIDFDQHESELVLYCQKDLLVHRFKTGERVSQFREKKQMTDVTCIQYDTIRKCLLVASRQNIVICKKTQEYHLNFNSQKIVKIDHQISCIRLNENSQTIFFGTSNGAIIFCPYPLQIIQQTNEEQQRISRVAYKSIKIHSQPLTDIMLTNNSKYLFTSIKGDGLSILRAKKINGKGVYNPFDISNYNFIETSTTPYLQNIHEKLKGLLQKRKTIFNELDQFKKEWDNKRIGQTKILTSQNKKKQLISINNALAEINRCKVQHAALLEELALFQAETQKNQSQNQKNHHKQLLSCYDENNKRKEKFDEVQNQCKNEWSDLTKQCCQNLAQIQGELQTKFNFFERTYLMMKQNLFNYRRRLQVEQQQEMAVKQQQITRAKGRLREQQEQLYRRNNQLKGQITKNKKQLQRFNNRQDFLENKQRFFAQELKYCDYQQKELIEVKETLQKQLEQLQNATHKKEKRLRKYFLQNQILIKYQLIHDNLTKQSNRQMQFIEEQHRKLRQNVGDLQKEILYVSEERQKHRKNLQIKKHYLQDIKVENEKIKKKRDFLFLQIQQIQDCVNNTNTGKIVDQESKNQDFLAIYQNFFVDKKLETFLSTRQAKTDDLIVSENKRNQKGVATVLQDHKQYLVRNMQLFQKYNTRVMDQINLTYLKYQTQNYDLISQCNVRKQQINKNKRILHELVDSIKDTNNHIAALHQQKPIHKEQPRPAPEVPFPLYEQMQQERQSLRKDKSQSALWKIKKSSYQVRKMLQIQKLKNSNSEPFEKATRRIQTATLKKKPLDSSHQQMYAQQSLDVMNPMGFIEQSKKPKTAIHRYRRKQNQEAKRFFSRNKSNSKPTTCTSHTKSKQSLFI